MTEHQIVLFLLEPDRPQAADECTAPFARADGDAYLATHHVVWLAQGGSDTVENTVALCPNCHRKMTGSFVHIYVYDAAAGLLTVLVGVPRGWGQCSENLPLPAPERAVH